MGLKLNLNVTREPAAKEPAPKPAPVNVASAVVKYAHGFTVGEQVSIKVQVGGKTETLYGKIVQFSANGKAAALNLGAREVLAFTSQLQKIAIDCTEGADASQKGDT